MQHDERIKFERESQQTPDSIPGDIIFVLKQKPHKLYRREGNNLYKDQKITFEESILGFTKKIKTVDKRTIEVSSGPNELVKPFSTKIIKGEGMPINDESGEKGDLHIKFIVEFPSQLSDKQKEAIKMIFKDEPDVSEIEEDDGWDYHEDYESYDDDIIDDL